MTIVRDYVRMKADKKGILTNDVDITNPLHRSTTRPFVYQNVHLAAQKFMVVSLSSLHWIY